MAAECAGRFPRNEHHLRLAFVGPGILFPEKSPAQISADDSLLAFRTNVLGPMLVMKHLAGLLPRRSVQMTRSRQSGAEGEDEDLLRNLPARAVYANISARVGSITDNQMGGWYSYRASKAALNQLTRTFDNHLRAGSGDNAIAVALHPGTVKTGLSKAYWQTVQKGKLFEPDFAAEQLLDVVKRLTVDGRGRCFDWKGDMIPP